MSEVNSHYRWLIEDQELRMRKDIDEERLKRSMAEDALNKIRVDYEYLKSQFNMKVNIEGYNDSTHIHRVQELERLMSMSSRIYTTRQHNLCLSKFFSQ